MGAWYAESIMLKNIVVTEVVNSVVRSYWLHPVALVGSVLSLLLYHENSAS